jgi:hypothetical protein
LPAPRLTQALMSLCSHSGHPPPAHPPCHPQVHSITTATELRRKGLAQLLLAAVLELAAACGLAVSSALVHHKGTQAFWQHLGYGKAQGCLALKAHAALASGSGQGHQAGGAGRAVLLRHLSQVGDRGCWPTAHMQSCSPPLLLPMLCHAMLQCAGAGTL